MKEEIIIVLYAILIFSRISMVINKTPSDLKIIYQCYSTVFAAP